MLLNKVLIRCLKWPNSLKITRRCLNLMEYQSKDLLRRSGVAIQDFCVVDNASKLENKLLNDVEEFVIKAQILAGGRGKGSFSNGFKGGVHITKRRNEVSSIVNQMLGHRLVTKQTPKDGIPVRKIMIAESVPIKRETYLCICMDRQSNGPVIIASPLGGVDIETVSEEQPEQLMRMPIDIFHGIDSNMAKQLADFLQFKGQLQSKAAEQIIKLWKLFLEIDATQLEINPLVETHDERVIAVDAKISFDDNAAFRQQKVFAMEDDTETDPRESDAAKYNLNYIGMDGNIGCLVNGAGLAMATMDIIKLHGGQPANFLDVGGGVNEDQVRAAFRILVRDERVRAILVNIFGGIVNCGTIANGLVAAMRSELSTKPFSIPVIVRLAGTDSVRARNILKECDLDITLADDLDTAAKKAVDSVSLS